MSGPSAEARRLRPGEQYRWDAAAREHQLALGTYLDTAGGLDEATWVQPRAAGKWSAAQVTEHLRLAYEVLLRELGGGEPPRLRVGRWTERLLRWFLLPHILYHRNLPVRATAPREVRPATVPVEGQEVALARLTEYGQRFERELHAAWLTGAGELTSPYFGKMAPVRTLRVTAIHIEHHRRQLLPPSREVVRE